MLGLFESVSAHDTEAIVQLQIGHEVQRVDVLQRGVVVGLQGGFLKLEAVNADVLCHKDLVGAPREDLAVIRALTLVHVLEAPGVDPAVSSNGAPAHLDVTIARRHPRHGDGIPSTQTQIRVHVAQLREEDAVPFGAIGEVPQPIGSLEVVAKLAAVRLCAIGLGVGVGPLQPQVTKKRQHMVTGELLHQQLALNPANPIHSNVGVDVSVGPLVASRRALRASVQEGGRLDGMVVPVLDTKDACATQSDFSTHARESVGVALLERVVIAQEEVVALERVLRPVLVPQSTHHAAQLPLSEGDTVSEDGADSQVKGERLARDAPVIGHRLTKSLEFLGLVAGVGEPIGLLERTVARGGPHAGRHGSRRLAEAEPVLAAFEAPQPALKGRPVDVGGADVDLGHQLVGHGLGPQRDHTPAELRRLVWTEGLLDDHALQHLGREQIERNHPTLWLGTGQRRTIQQTRGVALTQTADIDVLSIDNGEASDTLERARCIRIP